MQDNLPHDMITNSTVYPGDPTVKLYTCVNRGVPSYVLSWYMKGVRKRKSFSNVDEVAPAVSQIQSKIDITEVAPRDIRYYKLCEERLGGIPLDKAVQFYLDKHSLKSTGVSIPSIVSEFLKKQAARKDLSSRQMQSIRQHLRKFADHFPLEIAVIQAKDIDGYLDKPDWSPVTKHNHRQSIISLFNYAKKKGHLPKHEETEAQLSDNHKAHGTKKDIWTVQEMQSLIDSARAEGDAGRTSLNFIALGAFAGLRSAEIQRLHWGHLCSVQGFIALGSDVTKTRNARTVPISPNLAVILRDSCGNEIAPPKPYPLLKQISSRAGLNWKPNACRHSFASYHLALYNDPARTAAATGHSVKILNNTYKSIAAGGVLIDKAMAEAYFNIQ